MKKCILIAAVLAMAACGGTEGPTPATGAAPLPLAGRWLATDPQTFSDAPMTLVAQPDGSFVGTISTSSGEMSVAVPVGSLSLCINPDRSGACQMTLETPDLEATGTNGYQWSGRLRESTGQIVPFVANTVSEAVALPVVR